ncbi:hypothetical protein J3E69DRAFT_252298 [Trichoderma sp. SZMC 28015]
MLQTFPPPAPDILGLTRPSLQLTPKKPTGAELVPGQHGKCMELYATASRIVLASNTWCLPVRLCRPIDLHRRHIFN